LFAVLCLFAPIGAPSRLVLGLTLGLHLFLAFM
jgi:hypothetical protein